MSFSKRVRMSISGCVKGWLDSPVAAALVAPLQECVKGSVLEVVFKGVRG